MVSHRPSHIRLADKAILLDQGTVYSILALILVWMSITRVSEVPVDDEMIVETRLKPNEVGHIHPGQYADIRVDSYDSSRYGAIKGSVRQISPATYLDEKANPYYKVKVGLDRSWVGEREGGMVVIPGMTVQVDIKTGSKTIMEYVLKPVTRGFQAAFQQR